jgi:hypothetical protein
MRIRRTLFRFEASTIFHRGIYSTLNSRALSTSSSPSSSPIKEETIGTQFWTLPNVITLTRIAASPLIGYAIMEDMKDIALIGCVLGAFSDWLDGFIAKNFNQKVYCPFSPNRQFPQASLFLFVCRVSGVGSLTRLETKFSLPPLPQGS